MSHDLLAHAFQTSEARLFTHEYLSHSSEFIKDRNKQIELERELLEDAVAAATSAAAGAVSGGRTNRRSALAALVDSEPVDYFWEYIQIFVRRLKQGEMPCDDNGLLVDSQEANEPLCFLNCDKLWPIVDVNLSYANWLRRFNVSLVKAKIFRDKICQICIPFLENNVNKNRREIKRKRTKNNFQNFFYEILFSDLHL